MVAEITANYSSTDPGICPDAIFDIKLNHKTGTRKKLLLKDISILDKYEYEVVVELVF
jgi:hypothetical protein